MAGYGRALGLRAFAANAIWLSLLIAAAEAGGSDPVAVRFKEPPSLVRMRMFWRVFGPAWTRPEIDYQFGLLRGAGIGGVTAFFMYPVAVEGGEVHNQRYLSGEFLEMLGYAAQKARELGLRFSVAGGTGWPFGGPNVPALDAAQRLFEVKIESPKDGSDLQLPALQPGETYLGVFGGTNELTRNVARSHLRAGADELREPLSVFITGPSGMRVKRPALGAEGLVVDHYRSTAAERYLESAVEPMLRAAGGGIESIFCDSLEVYHGNWTPGFPAAFRKRRGYSLVPELPALFDRKSPQSGDLSFDYWRTLAELTEGEFTRPVSRWAHRHGVKLEMEAYGTPPNPLTAARFIDVPTGEQYEWKGFSLSRLAASGAHLAGKRIIGAEAWTWLGLPNRLGDSLSDMKLASDLHFLAGVNDLTGVDFAYSPRSAGAPGWLPYYGPVLNQNNPQWPWFHHLASYAARCQWMLRQGKPVADVALYLPVEDIFATGPLDQMLLGFHLRDHFVSGEKTDEFGLQTALRHHSDLIQTLLMGGFNYDGIDFFSMERLARAREGRLVAGDGSYSILILPNLAGVDLEALEGVLAFCRSGGTVIVTRQLPGRTYGRTNSSRRERLRRVLGALFGEAAAQRAGHQPSLEDSTHLWSRPCGRGRVIFAPDEQRSLRRVLDELQPDVRFERPQPEIGFVHRRSESKDIYFLVNVGEKPSRVEAGFRTPWSQAALWDPISGGIRGLTAIKRADGYASVELELPSRGSAFVVFEKNAPLPSECPPTTRILKLEPAWTLTFEGIQPPRSRALSNLVSWTRWDDSRFYSGSALYQAEFKWEGAVPPQAWLSLGEVHEVAEVQLNGMPALVAWMPPYAVDIARWLRAGTNSLAIRVANLPLNRFLGTPDEDLKGLRALYGNRFPDPEEKHLVPEPAVSGMLGPVTIRF